MSTLDLHTENAAAKAVRLMGGPVAVAREFAVDNYQTVQSWIRNGVPAKYCPRFELNCGVTRKELRPSDWFDYWPELAATPKAVSSLNNN